jgi:hypothetical protein
VLEGARRGACVCEQRGRADEEKGGWQKIRGGHVARPLGVRGQQAEKPTVIDATGPKPFDTVYYDTVKSRTTASLIETLVL